MAGRMVMRLDESISWFGDWLPDNPAAPKTVIAKTKRPKFPSVPHFTGRI